MTRPNGVFKTENKYQRLISRKVYETTPKAVFAALVVSYLLNHQGIEADAIDEEIRQEWKHLNDQNIVPQKPIK